MSILLQAIIVLACLMCVAFFSGTETGMVCINPLRLHHMLRRRISGAEQLKRFLDDPDKLLGTTLVGTNLFTVMASIMAASVFIHLLGEAGSWVSTIVMTILILVFCEYLPKAWFQSRPAERTRMFAPLLQLAQLLLAPISRMVMWMARIVFRLPPRGHLPARFVVTRDELKHLTGEIERSGEFSAREREMIHGVFELSRTTCADIMMPLENMVMVSADTSCNELLSIARAKSLNRFPVYHERAENLVGIVNVLDAATDANGEGKTASDYMRPPQFVPDDMPVDDLLQRMRISRQPMALVTSGASGIVGLATLEDVLEEIVGEL